LVRGVPEVVVVKWKQFIFISCRHSDNFLSREEIKCAQGF
jgi:hypothetical protein